MLEELEERGREEQQEELQLDLDLTFNLACSVDFVVAESAAMEGTKDLASINTLDLPEAGEGSATPSSPAKSTTRTPALKKVGLTPVTEAELISFLFPEGLQHPSSASRLFLFARYGPLVHGQIVGGSYKRHRALTKQELNDLIEQDEREELLALFLDPSVKNSLTPEEAAGVIGETRALPHVKDALFNFTKHEVRAFLKALRLREGLDEGAPLPFGVLSEAIEHEHEHRIEVLRHETPALVAPRARATPLRRGQLFKAIGATPVVDRPRAGRTLKVAGVPLGAGGAAVRQLVELHGACEGVVIPSDGGGKIGTVFKVQMASYEDATKAIAALDGLKWRGSKLKVGRELLAGQELDNFMVAERMLHKTAFEVSTIGVSTNDPALRRNLALLRPKETHQTGDHETGNAPKRYDMRQWDDMCCLRGQGKGSYAERAPHNAVPLGVAFGLMSRTVELNTSQHIPTIIPHTHRRQTFHLMTDAEKGIHAGRPKH